MSQLTQLWAADKLGSFLRQWINQTPSVGWEGGHVSLVISNCSQKGLEICQFGSSFATTDSESSSKDAEQRRAYFLYFFRIVVNFFPSANWTQWEWPHFVPTLLKQNNKSFVNVVIHHLMTKSALRCFPWQTNLWPKSKQAQVHERSIFDKHLLLFLFKCGDRLSVSVF